MPLLLLLLLLLLFQNPVNPSHVMRHGHFLFGLDGSSAPDCAFTLQAARASKWPEVIHFQCEPAASSGESGAARFGR